MYFTRIWALVEGVQFTFQVRESVDFGVGFVLRGSVSPIVKAPPAEVIEISICPGPPAECPMNRAEYLIFVAFAGIPVGSNW
jgi:hypothetical protein